MFATYLPPLATLGSTTTVPDAERAMRVPQEILTDELVEEIKSRCCFVSDVMPDNQEMVPPELRTRENTMDGDEDRNEGFEVPASDSVAASESEFSTAESDATEVPHTEASGISQSERFRATSSSFAYSESHLQGIAYLYKRHSRAIPIHMRVTPPQHQRASTGPGTLIIPGWIRERAAEVLFEGGDIDESSLAELILDVLLKTPIDLRKTLACSILVTGGTAMLSGFIQRLQAEILRAIQPPVTTGRRNQRHSAIPGKPSPLACDRYASLRPLLPHISILNNPSPPPPTSGRAAANAGKAPAFAPSLMAWIGGSLAGYVAHAILLICHPTRYHFRALKTGGVEIPREKWDEAAEIVRNAEDDEMEPSTESSNRIARTILPDWTRSSLPVGAPSANTKLPSTPLTPQATRITAR